MTGSTPRRHRRAPARGRQPSGPRIADLATAILGVGSIGLGIAYREPALTRPVPRPGARTVSVVQAIDAIGPVWFLAFVAVGALCLIGLRLPRLLVLAHSAGVVVFGMFACAVWLGWAFSEPRPPVVAPVLSSIVFGFQILALLVRTARRP